MRLGFGLACFLLAGCLAFGAPDSGAIAGVVLDGTSKAPIRRAIVTLSTVESKPQDAVAWTDAQGRFAFAYLPPGRYQVRAQRAGYQFAGFGTDTPDHAPSILPLTAGENRGDIVIRMQPFGGISGVVLDEDGDPIAGALVTTLRPGFVRQKRKLLPGNSITTDSHGRYRLALAPGHYAISTGRPAQRPVKSQPEVAAGQAQPQYTYSVQYYPGTDHSASAALLDVQAGKEIEGIDFQLAARPMAAIQGKVVPPGEMVPSNGAQVMMVDLDSTPAWNMNASAPPPGLAFRLENLAPGTYLAVAYASVEDRRYRGVQRVELREGTGEVTIPLEPAIDLAGRVTVEGPNASQHAAAYVNLTPGDGVPWQGQPQTKVNPDGTFKLTNVPPGIWDIGVGPIPPGGYLKSMRLGDQDVLTEEMVITSGTRAPLKIVLSTQAATVEGKVDQSRQAVVLLAPDGKFRHVLSFYKMAATDEEGHFEIKGATPGSYKLYAFQELDPRAIQDPEFLRPWERLGTPVELKEGRKTSQDLTLIPGATQ